MSILIWLRKNPHLVTTVIVGAIAIAGDLGHPLSVDVAKALMTLVALIGGRVSLSTDPETVGKPPTGAP